MSQELTSHIRNFFVFHVVLDRIIEVNRIHISQFHIVNSDTVVGKSLSVNIANGSANLQELLVLRNGFFEFTEIVIEDTGAIVGPALISGFSCSFASKCKDFVIL